jgi:hypothetical protein
MLKSSSKYLKIPAQVMKIVIFHYGWLKKSHVGHVGKHANVPKLGWLKIQGCSQIGEFIPTHTKAQGRTAFSIRPKEAVVLVTLPTVFLLPKMGTKKINFFPSKMRNFKVGGFVNQLIKKRPN